MKQILFRNWNVMRFVRLVLGLIILSQGILGKDPLSVGMGIFLSLLAVLNAGCCGPFGCDISSSDKHVSHRQKAIEYEEISA
jgi:hypothetical protein